MKAEKGRELAVMQGGKAERGPQRKPQKRVPPSMTQGGEEGEVDPWKGMRRKRPVGAVPMGGGWEDAEGKQRAL